VTTSIISVNSTTSKVQVGGVDAFSFTTSAMTIPSLVTSAINSTPIGATTPSTGAFTTLSASGTTTLASVSGSGSTVVVGGSPTNDNVAKIQLVTSTVAKNWQISSNNYVGSNLEFTPSTAGGGSTFTTPVMVLSSTGLSVTGTTTTNGANTQLIAGELDSSTTFIQSKNSGGTAKALAFYGSSEYGRFAATGDLLLGNTADSGSIAQGFTFAVGGGSLMATGHASGTASGTAYAYFDYNSSVIGSITQSGTTAVLYNTTSDYRLKTVIAPVSGAGARIDALNPVEYEWKADGTRTRGFLAHEFQSVYAQSVNGTKDAVDADGNPVYQSMQAGSSEVIADLVAEIKSLRARLAAAGL